MINSSTSKLVVVTPHPLECEILVLRLSMTPRFQVCGTADNEHDAARLIDQQAADVAIIDAALSAGSDFDMIRQFKSKFPELKMLVLSDCTDEQCAERMIGRGAHGYVSKRQPVDALFTALASVANGEQIVRKHDTQQMARVHSNGHASTVKLLSDRELQVFELIGRGYTSRSIADQLHLSRHTIDSHRENIKKKLGVKTSAELTRTAIQWQLEQG